MLTRSSRTRFSAQRHRRPRHDAGPAFTPTASSAGTTYSTSRSHRLLVGAPAAAVGVRRSRLPSTPHEAPSHIQGEQRPSTRRANRSREGSAAHRSTAPLRHGSGYPTHGRHDPCRRLPRAPRSTRPQAGVVTNGADALNVRQIHSDVSEMHRFDLRVLPRPPSGTGCRTVALADVVVHPTSFPARARPTHRECL
jgi:hypothetical protein